VVTRTRAQASALAERLATLGAMVIELPVIAIDDPLDGGVGLNGAADRLAAGSYAWVLCTSVNAVSRLVEALDGRPVPNGVSWAAVGSSTARALAEGGFRPDLVPTRSVGDALAEEFPVARPATTGASVAVLFPRAETVRGGLVEGLRAKGWTVDEVVAYRTVAGDPDPDAIAAARLADMVAFTASSTVERTIALLGISAVPPLVVSIGPVTSASARSRGLVVAAEAHVHTIEGLVGAIIDACGGDRRPPP
jgi:uroporphyrinogen-III synthase